MTNRATIVRVLLHKDGTPVKVGDEVTSFRGEKYVVDWWPSNGYNRVWVTTVDEPKQDAEFFVSVFELRWEDGQ